MVAALAGLAAGVPLGAVQAQELSEKSVRSMMEYAWTMTPENFTKPDGTKIHVDHSKPDKAMVPLDVAREVIKVGRISAYAQRCGLVDEQRQNYLSLMKREEQKNKWSDQQLLYMSQLHLFAVMLLTGKVTLVERDGDKEVITNETEIASNNESCSAEQALKVKETVADYVKTGPTLAASSSAPVATPPAPAAAPVSAPAPAKK